MQPDATAQPEEAEPVIIVTLPEEPKEPWSAGQIGSLPFEMLPYSLVAVQPREEEPITLDPMLELSRLPQSRIHVPAQRMATVRGNRTAWEDGGRETQSSPGMARITIANNTRAFSARFVIARTNSDEEPLVLLLGPDQSEEMNLPAGEWTMTRTVWRAESLDHVRELQEEFRAQNLQFGWRYRHEIRASEERSLENQLR